MSAKIWLAARKPKACAKCKSRNWDTMVVVAEAATTISKIDTINHVIEYSVESAKLAHNPIGLSEISGPMKLKGLL